MNPKIWGSLHIKEVYDIPAAAFNDDRIRRTLDEINPRLSGAWAAVVRRGANSIVDSAGEVRWA